MSVETVLSIWEQRLKADNIRQRVSEARDWQRIRDICAKLFGKLQTALREQYDRDLQPIRIAGLSLWNLAAFVAKDASTNEYGIGVGIGAVRLLDVTNTCRWAAKSRPEHEQHFAKVLGTILYSYSTKSYYAVRHWMIDPTLGMTIPYGVIPMQLGSRVDPDLAEHQRESLWIILSFIISHEVAHIMAGHVKGTVERNVVSMTGQSTRIPASDIDRGHEYQADLLALKTLFRMVGDSEKDSIEKILSDVGFFFAILNTVDQISMKPVFWGHVHPTPRERISALLDSLGRLETLQTSGLSDVKLRHAAQSSFAISHQLASWILESPQDFREQPLIIEDYQEGPDGNEDLLAGASLNNEADVLMTRGDAEGALRKYEEAYSLIRNCEWGDGHRIVLSNLIRARASLLHVGEALGTAQCAILSAFERNDRPTILYLARTLKRTLSAAGVELDPLQLSRIADLPINDEKFQDIIAGIPTTHKG